MYKILLYIYNIYILCQTSVNKHMVKFKRFYDYFKNSSFLLNQIKSRINKTAIKIFSFILITIHIKPSIILLFEVFISNFNILTSYKLHLVFSSLCKYL